MEEHITPERIVNAIMQDKRYKGHYLIVEGRKDLKLYKKFAKSNNLTVKFANGHLKVKRVLELLDTENYKKRIAIIDSDFNTILGKKEKIAGLFYTDNHDLEVMLIESDSLENAIDLYCNETKVKKFEEINNASVREIIYQLGAEIGYLKLANKKEDLGLVFKPKTVDGNQIKYNKFICTKTLNYLGDKALIDVAVNYSTNRDTIVKDKKLIKEELLKIKKNNYNILELINGHDLSNILFILMKTVLRSKNKMLVDFNAIEDSLILAYEYSFFKNTQLYNDLLSYETANKVKLFK